MCAIVDRLARILEKWDIWSDFQTLCHGGRCFPMVSLALLVHQRGAFVARKGPIAMGCGYQISDSILKVAVIMVTLSENTSSSASAECSSTTPQINDRDHFGSNIVSSTNERDFPSGPPPPPSAAASAAVIPHQNHPHGLWDLTNPEIGYEIAASSGIFSVVF